MSFTVGLISPYRKLTNEAIKIAQEKNISLVARTAGFEHALVCAKEMEKLGIDVIVVREITDAFLKGKIDIPIVPIPINSSDVLKAIVEAKNMTRTIVFANFRNCYKDIDILEKATECNIKQIVFYNEEEAYNKIKEISKKYEALIGGGYSTTIAMKYGMKSFLIETGRESLEYSLSVACKIAESRQQEQHKLKEISTIINQSNDGIVSIDKYGNITVFNPKAERIFGFNLHKLTERNREHVLEMTRLTDVITTEQPVYEELVNINNKNYVISTVPTKINQELIGGVCTLQEVSRVQKIEQEVRVTLHAKGLRAKSNFDDIIGESDIMKEIICKAKKFARTDFTILITGETGTGKELFAQSIHNYSKRKNGPFVAVNCAAIPDNLLEAELFGYEEGSFTGAKKGGKPGFFELAHNGTIFLDEIGDLPLALQVRLLRVIQEKEVIKIGGSTVIPVNVRIIASTNVQLLDKVLEGKFREDLYYRLSVLHLHICPLRERIDDLPLIATHILKKYNAKESDINIILSALSSLRDYRWPGNIRELENVLAKFSVLMEYNEMNYNAVMNELKTTCYPNIDNFKKPTQAHGLNHIKRLNIKTEYELISKMIKEDMPYHQIAHKLGISRTTLWRKMKKYQLL